MDIKERYNCVIEYFTNTMPNAKTELNYANTFELLCAVVLSAQCTDKRVNIVTKQLFEACPSPQIMAECSFEYVFNLVKSVSYPNNKARHLIELSRKIIQDFNGKVPSNYDDLVSLPGVGRKTANVVLSVAFNQPRMPVDTHVFRVSHRIGLVNSSCTTPLSVEKELSKNISSELLTVAHHWLILHGRYVCKSTKPLCDSCKLYDICLYQQNTKL